MKLTKTELILLQQLAGDWSMTVQNPPPTRDRSERLRGLAEGLSRKAEAELAARNTRKAGGVGR